MRLRVSYLLVGSCLFVALPPASREVHANEKVPADAAATLEQRVTRERAGRELFVQDWSKPDAKPAPGGDGLGPMFNDVSCVACHQLGGIGGAGQAEKNARLLHLVAPNGTPLRAKLSDAERTQKALQRVHPDLGSSTTTVVLHRHERDKAGEVVDFFDWLNQRLPMKSRRNGVLPAPVPADESTFRVHGMSVRLTERNTTALFGAGLIDSIPDAAIVAEAERQKKQHAPLISGRVAQTAEGAIGRFGWRGQIGSLQEFVLTACAVELGLQVPGHAQTALVAPRKGDVADTEFRKARTAARPNHDLTQEQCNALTAYVAGLPAPRSARAGSLNLAKSVQRGDRLFDELNCSVCHVRNLGSVNGLFSDLLLHDMGPGLSDPAPAMPEIHEQISPGSSSAYSGVSIQLVKNVTTNIHQEWRTPPLWGVANSAPYLHDGRAHSLEQAIQMHSGEGQRAAEAFRVLRPDQRNDLHNFLQSLTAPSDNPHPRGHHGPIAGGGFF